MRRRAGTRDRNHIRLLNVPAQQHRRGYLAARFGNFLDLGIARPLAASERTIGGKRDTMLAAGRQDVRLIEPGMIVALMGDERLSLEEERLFKQCDRKVRDADV